MKKQLRLMFDYGTYPIWIYEADGEFIDCDLVDEIRENPNLLSLVERIQNEYESLFVNTAKEFSYAGFPKETDRERFISLTKEVFAKLTDNLSDKYEVINAIDYSEL